MAPKVVIPNDVSNQARALKRIRSSWFNKTEKRFRISRHGEDSHQFNNI